MLMRSLIYLFFVIKASNIQVPHYRLENTLQTLKKNARHQEPKWLTCRHISGVEKGQRFLCRSFQNIMRIAGQVVVNHFWMRCLAIAQESNLKFHLCRSFPDSCDTTPIILLIYHVLFQYLQQ